MFSSSLSTVFWCNEDVSFHYPGQGSDKGLKGVSIMVAPGTTTGLSILYFVSIYFGYLYEIVRVVVSQ